jgi:hypothetical protein
MRTFRSSSKTRKTVAKKRAEIEPTAEDFERVDAGVANARENLRYILARRYAEVRVSREDEARRRVSRFRRTLRFGRA